MTASFAHPMPFGAELRDDGSVRFRLWAPAQESVSVALDDRALPMAATGDGWFELVTDAAGAGSRYRYRLADGFHIPDPASRAQAEDVHGASLVVDPRHFRWHHPDWAGRPWQETVLYELHTGAFTPEGTFEGLRRRLDHFREIGVTAIELMPVADFPGRRNWGYDGVLPFAPDTSYGSPDDLKALIDDAHGHELMVFLDVVYNHFGPDGNYLHLTAPEAFTERHHTPWGAAIDFSRRPVRDYFIANALYWIDEFRIDGLRFDAVHAIFDDSAPHILTELAETVRRMMVQGRHVHLVLENDANQARYLGPDHYDAQWNDDFHHAAHTTLTGESGGYYTDFADRPVARVGRTLAEGFAYQGEPSAYRDGEARGEPSSHLPPFRFVNFLQNHDQVGNRAFGERLTTLAPLEGLRTLTAILLLAPSIPMLFMGEELRATTPFLFFCDFEDGLADAVREGRRREFKRFPQFADKAARERIPDPNAVATFEASRIDWSRADESQRELVKSLLAVRRAEIVPRLEGAMAGRYSLWDENGLSIDWTLGDGSGLTLIANLCGRTASGSPAPAGRLLFETAAGVADGAQSGRMPAWSAAWCLQ